MDYFRQCNFRYWTLEQMNKNSENEIGAKYKVLGYLKRNKIHPENSSRYTMMWVDIYFLLTYMHCTRIRRMQMAIIFNSHQFITIHIPNCFGYLAVQNHQNLIRQFWLIILSLMIIILMQYAWIAYKEDMEIRSLWPRVPHLLSWGNFQRSSKPLRVHRQF